MVLVTPVEYLTSCLFSYPIHESLTRPSSSNARDGTLLKFYLILRDLRELQIGIPNRKLTHLGKEPRVDEIVLVW